MDVAEYDTENRWRWKRLTCCGDNYNGNGRTKVDKLNTTKKLKEEVYRCGRWTCCGGHEKRKIGNRWDGGGNE